MYQFGPPVGVIRLSPWPWLDHPASGLIHATIAHFGLAFASAPSQRLLTLPRKLTRRLIMQKARRRTGLLHGASTVCRHAVSGSISLRLKRFFSPFPHGTCALSVTGSYLALEGGPSGFTRDFSCPVLLRYRIGSAPLSIQDFHLLRLPLSRNIPLALPNPMSPALQPRKVNFPVWAVSLSLAATKEIEVSFFSCGY